MGSVCFTILSRNAHAYNACVAMVKSCDKLVMPRVTASIMCARARARARVEMKHMTMKIFCLANES